MLKLLLSLVLVVASMAASAMQPQAPLPLPESSPASLVEQARSIPPEQAGNFVAPLSDREVRNLLIQSLRENARGHADQISGTDSLSVRFINGLQQITPLVQLESEGVFASWDNAAEEFQTLLRNLTGAQGWPAVGSAAVVFLAMLAGGFLAELGFLRFTSQFRERIQYSAEQGGGLQGMILEACLVLYGLLLFVLTAYLLSLVFFDRFDPLRVLVTTW